MITLSIANPAISQVAGILLHGYGADETDMESVARTLGYVPEWALPRAPFAETGGGYAWFPLPADLQDSSSYDPEPLPSVAATLAGKLRQHYPGHEFVLGGFSQGGMMALELAFCLPVRTLLLFSTMMIARDRWEQQIQKLPNEVRIFQSHGRQDEILPLSGAQLLAKALAPQRTHCFHLFEGGHGIPPAVCDLARKYLNSV